MCERFENSPLGISTFRSETHVAQQSRRDKLRAPQSAASTLHVREFPNQLVELPSEDLILVRSDRNCDLLYDPTMFSSEMLNFSMNTHVLLSHKDAVLNQESDAGQSIRSEAPGGTSFANSSHTVSSNFTPAKVTDPQNPCYWKGIGSQQSCDWIVNYANGSGGNGGSQSPLFVGEILPGNVKEASLSASSQYLKPSCNGYQQVQSSFTNPASVISSQDGQKQYGELNICSPFYQNTLQEFVTSSTKESLGFEMASPVQQNIRETSHVSWLQGGNELPSRLDNTAAWMHKAMGDTHQWNDELGFVMNKGGRNLETVGGDSTARGLSLSLSSHAPSELHLSQFRDRFGSENLQSRTGICTGSRDLKTNSSGYLLSKSPLFNKGYENSVQDIVSSSTYACRSSGPLGPFTGYATILKNSKFMKPAQQLLDEFCSVTGPTLLKTCEMFERSSRDVSNLSDPINAEIGLGGTGGNSGMSSSFYSSNEAGGEVGVGSESCQSYHPEFQQKKAKLLYMQEEVCRRYKLYHQQMQSVVSSFESVVGLSAATPYTSLALKTISRHFRCLKNSISDQIRYISKALGEDLSSPTTGTCSSKGEMSIPRLGFINQSLRKQKAGGDGLGFLQPHQHVWRPQRGLPERAVSVLKAWLFEHFLHPYPTDTDKHMLATQTGLSRNQVSNWFINARVRVWKPMVEEMHMLETKGDTEMNLNSGRNNTKPDSDNDGRQIGDLQPSDKPMIDAMSLKQLEYSIVEPAPSAQVGESSEQWSQKRSRLECQISTGVDGSLMGFVPYHQSGLEIGGIDAVSLTLGLRQSAEGAHLQQQHQQEHHKLRRQFGCQMVHDFVG